jgi:enoyl-[acyl-carrier protein] reductase I
MGFLEGKRALIVGVASPRSIAWGIAEAMHQQGAELAYTYQNDKLKPRVQKIADQTGSTIVLPCDVGSDKEIEAVFSELAKVWDGYDILVHSVGFAPRDQLEGDYMDCVTREGFQIAHDISSYSFAALAKAGLPMMEGRDASMLTLTYAGSVKALAGYNVMGLAKASLEANVRYMARSLGPGGVRVNAISAGPIKTLAAAGMNDHATRSRQRGRISVLGPRFGRNRRDHLRGFGLQHSWNDRPGRRLTRPGPAGPYSRSSKTSITDCERNIAIKPESSPVAVAFEIRRLNNCSRRASSSPIVPSVTLSSCTRA